MGVDQRGSIGETPGSGRENMRCRVVWRGGERRCEELCDGERMSRLVVEVKIPARGSLKVGRDGAPCDLEEEEGRDFGIECEIKRRLNSGRERRAFVSVERRVDREELVRVRGRW